MAKVNEVKSCPCQYPGELSVKKITLCYASTLKGK